MSPDSLQSDAKTLYNTTARCREVKKAFQTTILSSGGNCGSRKVLLRVWLVKLQTETSKTRTTTRLFNVFTTACNMCTCNVVHTFRTSWHSSQMMMCKGESSASKNTSRLKQKKKKTRTSTSKGNHQNNTYYSCERQQWKKRAKEKHCRGSLQTSSPQAKRRGCGW